MKEKIAQLAFLLVLLALGLPWNAMAGAACVVAKTKGNSEAVELAYTQGPAEAALSKAKENLKQKGH